LTEAFTALEAGLAIHQRFAESEPDNADYATALGLSYAFRGGARVRARRPAEAAADLRKAVQLWGKVASFPVEVRF
jgi:hypothetical protein